MTDDPKPRPHPELTKRARERAKARKHRTAKVARREAMLELVVSGYERELIARKFGVSVATVRREVDRAIDERRPDSHEHHIRLQVARVTKALRATDDAIERGKFRAVDSLIKLVGILDRYQGLVVATAPEPSRVARQSGPLELTHSPTPSEEALP
jgi:hypothetical protein